MSGELELVVPGRNADPSDLVPSGWAESVVAAWAKDQDDPAKLKDAADDLESAVHYLRKKKKDFVELQKAQRYIEIRLGELLRPYTSTGRRRGAVKLPGGVQASWEYRRLALNREDCLRWIQGGEVTRSRLLARITQKEAAEASLPGIGTLAGMDDDDRQYQVIVADPPWRYDFTETPAIRAIENQYTTMPLDELKALAVPAAKDCVLFLWATAPKLPEALELIGAWGFRYVTNAVWVKPEIGMGYYFRMAHEHLLVAKRGNPPTPIVSARVKSWKEEPRLAHSVKPPVFMEIIEHMYPELNRLEMFARNHREGWTAWGHAVTLPGEAGGGI